jgi:hypothetical protein
LSHELCLISITHPLLLFFFPIVLGIVIVRNAEGQPKELGGCDCPHPLKQYPEQSHHEEQIEVIIVPPALPPMVPPAAARTKKEMKKAAAPTLVNFGG